MSSLSLAFLGDRQWMPFLMLTTCETRQSDTVGISVAACSGDTLRCSARNFTVCALAWSQALLRSGSNPMVIQDFSVSMRGKSSGLPLITSTVMLNSLYAVSMAVRLTSPLPCPAWESPVHNSAPGTCTGTYSEVPATISRISRLPAYSPGGTLLYWPGSLRATPSVPGNGLSGMYTPGRNSVTMRSMSRYMYLT